MLVFSLCNLFKGSLHKREHDDNDSFVLFLQHFLAKERRYRLLGVLRMALVNDVAFYIISLGAGKLGCVLVLRIEIMTS